MKTEKRNVSKFEDSADYEPGVIVCECASTDHSLIYQKWEEYFGDKNVREVFLSFCLEPDRNFWKRLKNAYKYLFKKERTRLLSFSEISTIIAPMISIFLTKIQNLFVYKTFFNTSLHCY